MVEGAGDDGYWRLASFLQRSGLGFLLGLRPVRPPGFWRETLWDRVMPSNPAVAPRPTNVSGVIEQADRDIAGSDQLDPHSFEYGASLTSTEIALTRAVGTAVDDGDFELAQSAVDRIRLVAQKMDDGESLAEALSYLGVAELRQGLTMIWIEQPLTDII